MATPFAFSRGVAGNPLLIACRQGNLDEIRRLLESGRDVNVMVPLPESRGTHVGSQFVTPLYTARAAAHVANSQILCEHT